MATSRCARCVSRARLVAAFAGAAMAVAGFVSPPGATCTSNGVGPAGRTASAGGSRTRDTIPASAQLTWRPESPTQGTLVVLRITPAPGAELKTAVGEGGGEDLHFYAVDGGALESLVPVPVDASGSVEVAVALHYASGSSRALEASIPVTPGSFHHEKLEVAPELGSPLSKVNAARLARDQAKAREVSREAEQSRRLWTHRVVLPRKSRVTGEFGDGRIFNGQVSSRHLGLDLNGAVGDTVVATTRGVVALVDRFLLAGNIVYVNHGSGLISGYFHLSKQLVAVGDTVEAGTPIGLVGATGRVTGPHLHWVVRYGTTSVNPESLIPALAGR